MTIATRPSGTPPRRWPGVLAWAVAGATVLSLVPSVWLLSLVWREDSLEAAPTLVTVGPVTLAVASSVTVGAVLASRRPGHPVGWLLLGVGGVVAVNVLVEPYVEYGLVTRPGRCPPRADAGGPGWPRPRRW